MTTAEDLTRVRDRALEQRRLREANCSAKVAVATGTCGLAAGAQQVLDAIRDEIEKRGMTDVSVVQTGCNGLCEQEPIVQVSRPGEPAVTYGYIDAERARQIVAQHLVNGIIIADRVVGWGDQSAGE